MEGYIVRDSEGKYLAKRMIFYPQKDDGKAFVHSERNLDRIRKRSVAWGTKPSTLTPARWTPESGVVVTGDPVPFNP